MFALLLILEGNLTQKIYNFNVKKIFFLNFWLLGNLKNMTPRFVYLLQEKRSFRYSRY